MVRASALHVWLDPARDQLSRLAREGFQGYIRSYATHSKDTKHIFHVRALHFGHAAKSFALREQPKLAVRDQ